MSNNNLKWVMVDVESDGPAPGLYSMVCFGAVVVEERCARHFYSGLLRPVSDKYIPEALAVSGHSRAAMVDAQKPSAVMEEFEEWLAGLDGSPRFVSDNNGFDWQFINWYFWQFLGRNPFGHSSTNLGSLYKGLVKDGFKNFKHLRKTPHTHNPVDDARGNAEAMLHMIGRMGLHWE